MMGAFERATRVAQRYAKGGLVNSSVPGRTDKHPMKVQPGSYVFPADVVSGLGENNTMAGAERLSKIFNANEMPFNGGKQPSLKTPKISTGRMKGTQMSARSIRQRFAEGGGAHPWDKMRKSDNVEDNRGASPATLPFKALKGAWDARQYAKGLPYRHRTSPLGREAGYDSFAEGGEAHLSPSAVDSMQAISSIAPNGLPWEKMRQSENVEDRRPPEAMEDSFNSRFPGYATAQAKGEQVDIIVAGGEFLLSPDQVAAIGGGDPEKGFKVLDAFVKLVRSKNVKTLKGLPPPKK